MSGVSEGKNPSAIPGQNPANSSAARPNATCSHSPAPRRQYKCFSGSLQPGKTASKQPVRTLVPSVGNTVASPVAQIVQRCAPNHVIAGAESKFPAGLVMGSVDIQPVSENARFSVRDIFIQRQIRIHRGMFHWKDHPFSCLPEQISASVCGKAGRVSSGITRRNRRRTRRRSEWLRR